MPTYDVMEPRSAQTHDEYDGFGDYREEVYVRLFSVDADDQKAAEKIARPILKKEHGAQSVRFGGRFPSFYVWEQRDGRAR